MNAGEIFALVLIWTMVILWLIFGTGCSSVPAGPSPEWSRSDLAIMVQNVGPRKADVYFHPDPDEAMHWTHVVQEIDLGDGRYLVECFNLARTDYLDDHHAWPSDSEYRTMKVYMANVEGVDEWEGFAHLPHNGLPGEEPTMRTNVGPNFNAAYQALFRTTGRITARSEYYVTWSLHGDGQETYICIPAR